MKKLEQITNNEGEWLRDVCNHIDNQDALEFALSNIGASFISNDEGIFANIEDVKKADEWAFNEDSKNEKDIYETTFYNETN